MPSLLPFKKFAGLCVFSEKSSCFSSRCFVELRAMNKTDYNKLKKQVEDKYQETLRLAEKERKDGLEAIDRVWELLKEAQQIPNGEKDNRIQTNNKTKYGSFTIAIKEAIRRVPTKRFTKKDIRVVLPQVDMEIAASCKDASLTGCLIRLEKKGIIEKIKAGKGSSPSLYKKVSGTQD